MSRQFIFRIIRIALFLMPMHLCSVAQNCGEAQSQLAGGPPIVSNATLTTSCGYFEMDHHWTRQQVTSTVSTDALNSTLRYGLTRRIDVQWSYDEFASRTEFGKTTRSIGDNAFAVRYRFKDSSKNWPALGFRYAIKVPTSSLAVGGSGFVDHQVSALLSRDIRQLHFDFNAIETFYGSGQGWLRGDVGALAAMAPLNPRLSWVLEIYGGTQSDRSTFASQYFGTVISANPRCAFDIGMDVGLKGATPKRRLLFGFSYSLGKLHSITRAAALSPQH